MFVLELWEKPVDQMQRKIETLRDRCFKKQKNVILVLNIDYCSIFSTMLKKLSYLYYMCCKWNFSFY